MSTNDNSTDIRTPFIAGLRALADYLEANPALPLPPYGRDIIIPLSNVEDGGMAEVDAVAVQLGTPISDQRADYGSYTTARSFGPIAYKCVSHTRASMDEFRALNSYHGCVTPDVEAPANAS